MDKHNNIIKGIIFDMDGTVIDSNHVHYENWNSIFEKRYDITLPKKDFAMKLGKSAKHFTQEFLDEYKIEDDAESFVKDIVKNHENLKHKVKLKRGLKKRLPELKKKYRLAIATGANNGFAVKALESLGVLDFFDFIIGGDMVKEAKPDPEIFLKAAEGLGLKPEECIVIEDAYLGMKAAKNARMKCIAVEDEFTKHQDHSIADAKIKSMLELDDELIGRL